MHNNTPDDYIEAIRIKYEVEKEDGIYSNYLSSPSQANLRDLCWKIFKSDFITADDLKVYSDFFKFEFDANNENTSTHYTDKFKKVGAFLRREKRPAKIDTINFAAILVGFEWRPYPKFKRKCKIEVEGNSVAQDEEMDDFPEELIDECKEIKTFGTVEDHKVEAEMMQPKTFFLATNFKEHFFEKFRHKVRRTVIGVVGVFIFGFVISHYVFPKKQCMQWSNDHYEKVDCDLKIEVVETLNKVEVFDQRKYELRKIRVCDTTTCFNNNGEALVWYAKTKNGIDFFNTHGTHPENGKALKPMTQYIFDKYIRIKNFSSLR
jgi:hypothetical protein